MKKLFILLILILLTVFVKAQTFPITQNLGSPTTLIKVKGGIKADSGFVNTIFADTTAANGNPYIKNYVGAAIFTTSDNTVWVRNAAATAWVAQAGATNITINNIYNNSFTEVTVINQVDSSITVEFCTGAGACDTATYVTNVYSQATSYYIDSTHFEICGLDSTGENPICDTITIPAQYLYVFQKSVDEISAGVVQLVNDTTTAKNVVYGLNSQGRRGFYPLDSIGFILAPTCGLQNGTGIVSYDDSTLNFDISAAIYALCCDNIPRSSPFTHVTLDSNDAADPRIDAIVLDSTGVVVLKGTPDANPASPQLSSCQILLVNILINAGDNVPANISVTPIPYDEGLGTAGGEWDTASTGVTVNFRDIASPAHLTHDIFVSPYTTATSNTLTLTNNSTIQITDYSVLKLYIKLPYVVSIGRSSFINLRWGNGGQWQSDYLPINNGSYGFNSSLITYQILTIPISDFRLYSGTVNKLQITLRGNNAHGIYIDWIQLQSGLNQGGGTNSGTVTQFSSGNLSPLFTTSVTNPTTTPALSFTQSNATAYRVFGNSTNTAAPPTFTQVDLSTSMVTGLLPVTNLSVAPANYYLGSLDGSTNQWLPLSNLFDTAYTIAPIRTLHGAIRDTIYLDYTNGLTTKGDSLALGGTLTQNTTIIGTGYRLSLGADTILLNSTLSGASSGYIWKLKDPTTGSGYWASNGVPINNLLAATGTNTIDNADYPQTWTWNSLTSNPALTLSSSSTGLSGTTPKLLYLSLSGVNSNSNQNSYGLYVNNSSSGTHPGNFGIYSTCTSSWAGTAVAGSFNGPGAGGYFVSTTGIGVEGSSSSGSGGYFTTTTGVPLGLYSQPSSTNTVIPSAQITRGTSGTAANGIGQSIDLLSQNSNGTINITNQLISKWTDATTATRTSQFIITGVDTSSLVNLLTLDGTGYMQMKTMTAAVASSITPSDGMIVYVSTTNGTFTAVGFWGYVNGAWAKLN